MGLALCLEIILNYFAMYYFKSNFCHFAAFKKSMVFKILLELFS